MTNNDEEEVRELRWKAHDAAQMVTALGVRKVSVAREGKCDTFLLALHDSLIAVCAVCSAG